MNTSFRRGVRLSRNFLPVTFAGVFAAGALCIAVGVTTDALIIPALILPFVVVPVWLSRCAVRPAHEGQVAIVNPWRTVRLDPDEVIEVRRRALALGQGDIAPLLVRTNGKKVGLVAMVNRELDLEGWRRLTTPMAE